jgi:hypothetical protein
MDTLDSYRSMDLFSHHRVGSIEHEWIWSYNAFEEAEKAYTNEPF